MTGTDRGQAYTLEGLIAAIILASAVLYGLQAVDVAPYTADDRSDRRLEVLRTQVSDALAVAADNGTLRRAVTCIDPSTGDPHPRLGQPPNAVSGGDETALGSILNATVGGTERQYIVLFDYWSPDASPPRQLTKVVYSRSGSMQLTFTREPVTVTHQVPVFNSTTIRTNACNPEPSGQTVEGRATSDDLYLPYSTPASSDRELYAVVTVRVIAW